MKVLLRKIFLGCTHKTTDEHTVPWFFILYLMINLFYKSMLKLLMKKSFTIIAWMKNLATRLSVFLLYATENSRYILCFQFYMLWIVHKIIVKFSKFCLMVCFQASLVGQVQKLGLLEEGFCFVELGAGKGQYKWEVFALIV